jgi:2'-5' RNA ligase
VRAFFAFEIPETVTAKLETARDRVRATLPPARWTRPRGWHLSVKFLGETERGVLERLTAELGPQLRDHAAVTVELSGGGFFPAPVKPRVAWIGGTTAGGESVVGQVEAAAVRAGFAAEKRPWSPHVTMARLKSRWPRGAVESYLEWAAELRFATFVCREVVLFESRLQTGGAVYTALERIPLE